MHFINETIPVEILPKIGPMPPKIEQLRRRLTGSGRGPVRDHRVATRGRRRSWRLVSLSPRIFLWTQLPTSAINVHQFDPV